MKAHQAFHIYSISLSYYGSKETEYIYYQQVFSNRWNVVHFFEFRSLIYHWHKINQIIHSVHIKFVKADK